MDVSPRYRRAAFALIAGATVARLLYLALWCPFDLAAGANASIEVYNDASQDTDADGLFAAASTAETTKQEDGTGKFQDVTLAPVLIFDKKKAWTKYRVDAHASLKADIKVPFGGAKLDTSGGVVFADYHLHKSSDTVGTALLSDVANLRIAADPDHIIALPEGDAL